LVRWGKLNSFFILADVIVLMLGRSLDCWALGMLDKSDLDTVGCLLWSPVVCCREENVPAFGRRPAASLHQQKSGKEVCQGPSACWHHDDHQKNVNVGLTRQNFMPPASDLQ
jgi:hypothetical protein